MKAIDEFIFNGKDRKEVLRKLADLFEKDARINALILVGSGACGWTDIYSDIDLIVLVDDEVLFSEVFKEWEQLLKQNFKIIQFHERLRVAGKVALYAILLEGFLELDVSFVPLKSFVPMGDKWKIIFNKTTFDLNSKFKIESSEKVHMDYSLEYEQLINAIWYYVLNAVISIKRFHYWKALYHIEEIRNRTIKVIGWRFNIDTHHYNDLDAIPEDLKNSLQEILLGEVSPENLKQVLINSTELFFSEAKLLEKELDEKIASNLERSMKNYLKLQFK